MTCCETTGGYVFFPCWFFNVFKKQLGRWLNTVSQSICVVESGWTHPSDPTRSLGKNSDVCCIVADLIVQHSPNITCSKFKKHVQHPTQILKKKQSNGGIMWSKHGQIRTGCGRSRLKTARCLRNEHGNWKVDENGLWKMVKDDVPVGIGYIYIDMICLYINIINI